MVKTLNWLSEILEEYNLTAYKIHKLGNINKGTIYNIIERDTPITNIGLSTAHGIAKALNLTFYEFIEKYYQ